MLDRILCFWMGRPRVRRFALLALGFCFTIWLVESWEPRVSQGRVPDLSAAELQKLRAENIRLKAALDQYTPDGVHIVVDSVKNRLYLKKGRSVILEAVCSTGNGKILKDPVKNRSWVFNTPVGEHHIIKKVDRPVWTKPDWAFIEEGEEIPSSFKERIEEDMLGDYAMHIGNSYMIHGTLYRRLIGRSVTHGCIRLGDADLEKVFKASHVGTPVFIY